MARLTIVEGIAPCDLPTLYRTLYDAAGERPGRPIGPHTTLHTTEGGGVAVRLYSTDVVTLYPDHLTVTCGKWNTPTTRDRIKRVLRPLDLSTLSHSAQRDCFGAVIHTYSATDTDITAA